MQMWSALLVISATRVAQGSAHASQRSCHEHGHLANPSLVLVAGQLSGFPYIALITSEIESPAPPGD